MIKSQIFLEAKIDKSLYFKILKVMKNKLKRYYSFLQQQL